MKIINTKTGEILWEDKWQDYRMATTSPSTKLEVTRTEAPSAGGTETPADPETAASGQETKV